MTTPVLVEIQKEVTKELANKEVMVALVSTTFKGLNEVSVKQAITEGMMRGFNFKDFLERNVYAIPFGSGYSLVTSIDYARKIGAKSGVVGKSKPTYKFKENGSIDTCEITIKKKIGDYIGDFTEEVYFDEYNTGKNQWVTKPKTMIAKVAEMHALRMACPEELSQAYAEEELQKSDVLGSQEIPPELSQAVNEAKTVDELKAIWEEHKGLGKEFGKLVVNQKKFLEGVAKDENGNS